MFIHANMFYYLHVNSIVLIFTFAYLYLLFLYIALQHYLAIASVFAQEDSSAQIHTSSLFVFVHFPTIHLKEKYQPFSFHKSPYRV